MRYGLLALMILFGGRASAQLNGKYNFRHIDQSDGLIHSDVLGIGQDKKGFIWVLTVGGLQRYDGTRFVDYTEVLNPATGDVANAFLYVDTIHNSVCVEKERIMERLDLVTNKFNTLTLQQAIQEDTIHPAVTFIDEEGSEHVISMTGNIQYEHSEVNEEGTWFNKNPGLKNRDSYTYYDSLSGNIWGHNYMDFFIADPRTKNFYSTGDKKLANSMLMDIKKGLPKNRAIKFFMVDSDHNLWIATWSIYLYRYNLITREFKTYSLQDIKTREGKEEEEDFTLVVDALFEDRQKNIWVSTDYAGLLFYNRENDDFDFITSDEKISNGLRYNFIIHSIFQDRDDNIWLGTDRGINIFNPYRNNFQSIRHIEGTNTSLPRKDILDVCETQQGEILVSTWGGGITIYDQQWNFIKNVKFKGDRWQNLVWHFIENDDGTIWAGAQAGYIHIYDPTQHTFKTIHPPETQNFTIVASAKDQNGNIILGLHGGKITVWNKSDQKFYTYQEQADQLHAPFSLIRNIYVDRQNHCWVGTDQGLMEFNIQKRCFEHFYHPGDSIVEIIIQGIEQYNDSMLIVGSRYGGIYFFNLNSHLFERPFHKEQFNNLSVYALRFDEQKNLWLTTNYDIIKFDSQLSQKTQYNLGKHINTASFESRKFYELNDGRWVTTTPTEIICFNPGKLEVGQDKHNKVEISGFKVLNHPIHIDSVLSNGLAVFLPYDKNFISIEFSALDFSNILETNYYYRLTGVDKTWNYSTTRLFADYTDLKPGEYTFEVKSNQGSGDSVITSFPILITPPWWGTFWFRVLLVFFAGSLIYFLLKKRIQTIRKESELKHRIAETEMMALRSQMNPHFIFNCINGIDAMIQSNDKYSATMYLNKFAKLIRNVLESSKQNKVPLSKDLETLQLYIDLELFRHKDKFTASIQADEELLENDYKVPPLVIQPYVENAILHGLRHRTESGGRLVVNVSKTNDHIIYIIEDNGIGRKGSNGSMLKHEEGYGMQMSQDRIRLFNDEEAASVVITDLKSGGKPSGTRIEVQLKIQ